MKKTYSILLLLITSLSLMSFSCTKSKPKAINVNAVNTLKQYVGDYVYEAAGIILKVYTKEKENNAKLYFYVSGDRESELVKIGEHKFSFEMSGVELRVEFENPGNGVFKELIFIQPDGSFKAIRK